MEPVSNTNGIVVDNKSYTKSCQAFNLDSLIKFYSSFVLVANTFL